MFFFSCIFASLDGTSVKSSLLLDSLSSLKLPKPDLTEKVKSCQEQLEVIVDEETMVRTGDAIQEFNLVPFFHLSSKGVKNSSTGGSLSSGVVIVRSSLIPPSSSSIGLDGREEHLLSTVIEEQDQELLEQDSLEEFIKYETECGILPDSKKEDEESHPQVIPEVTTQKVTDSTSSSSTLVSEGGNTATGGISNDSVSHLSRQDEEGQQTQEEKAIIMTTTTTVSPSQKVCGKGKEDCKSSSSHVIQEKEEGIIIVHKDDSGLDGDPSLESAWSSSPERMKNRKEETTSTNDSDSATSYPGIKRKDCVEQKQHLNEKTGKQHQQNKNKESPSETDSLLSGRDKEHHQTQDSSDILPSVRVNCQRKQAISSSCSTTRISSKSPPHVNRQEDTKNCKTQLRAAGKKTLLSSATKKGDDRDQQLLNEKDHSRRGDVSSAKLVSVGKKKPQKTDFSPSSTSPTLMSSSSKSTSEAGVVRKTDPVNRENLLNEIENYSRSHLKNSPSSTSSLSSSALTSHFTSSSHSPEILESKKSENLRDIHPSKSKDMSTTGANILIQSLEEDQQVMDQVVMDNLKKKTTGEKTFADHFLPSESKGFLMRSPLPDNDVVTSLDFETIEVVVDDGIASDDSSEKSVDSPSSSSTKSRESLSSPTSSPSASDSKQQQNTNNQTCSNKSAKKCVTPNKNSKDMNEKRKGSSSSSSNNLSNYGLVSKRSSSIKDLREKQNDAEVKIAKEIIELKQREEELKLMRQEMLRIQNHHHDQQQQTSASSSSFPKQEKLLHHLPNEKNSPENIVRQGVTSCSTRSDSSGDKSCAILNSSSVASVSDVSSVEMDTVSSSCPRSSSPSTNSEVSTTDSVSGRISVDSLDSSASSAAAKRMMQQQNSVHSNRIQQQKQQQTRSIRSMKPYEEAINEASRSKSRSTSHLNESPIEREIRLVREREEELRREIQMRKQLIQQQTTTLSTESSKMGEDIGVQVEKDEQSGQISDSVTPAKSIPAIDDKSLALSGENSSSGQQLQQSLGSSPLADTAVIPALGTASSKTTSIQKVLATTRIQQEIEEQTQREMALRASGSIKTISQERTDLKVPTTQLASIASAVVKAANAASINNIAMTLSEDSNKSPPRTSG